MDGYYAHYLGPIYPCNNPIHASLVSEIKAEKFFLKYKYKKCKKLKNNNHQKKPITWKFGIASRDCVDGMEL